MDVMGRERVEIELDADVLELARDAARAAGRVPDEVITEAASRQLRADALDDMLTRVRLRSDLTDEQALALSYEERDATRAGRDEFNSSKPPTAR